MAETIDWDGLGLPPEHPLLALRDQCPGAVPMRFADADLIIDPAEDTRDCVLLLRGSCLVEELGSEVTRKAGTEIAIVEATPEEPVFVGEMASLAEGCERVAAVRSAMNAWGIRLSPDDLNVIVENFPDLTRILCRALSQRLREVSLHLRRFRSEHALGFTHVLLTEGETLYKQGDASDTLWQIVQGQVALTQGSQSEMIQANFEHPSFLELAAYLRGEPHAATATASTPVVALCIPLASRLAVLRSFPAQVLQALTV